MPETATAISPTPNTNRKRKNILIGVLIFVFGYTAGILTPGLLGINLPESETPSSSLPTNLQTEQPSGAETGSSSEDFYGIREVETNGRTLKEVYGTAVSLSADLVVVDYGNSELEVNIDEQTTFSEVAASTPDAEPTTLDNPLDSIATGDEINVLYLPDSDPLLAVDILLIRR